LLAQHHFLWIILLLLEAVAAEILVVPALVVLEPLQDFL
jgi:hypothetical protein